MAAALDIRMNLAAPSNEPSVRLARLKAYVQQDPINVRLLAEASEAALACGQPEQAESWLAAAEGLEPGSAEWPFRRAQLCIARRDLDGAMSLLEQLRSRCGEHPGLMHDLAYVHLLRGDPAASRSLLQAWAQCDFDVEGLQQHAGMLQALWLRACHQLGALEEAWDAIERWCAAGRLDVRAAGVAALLALDQGEADHARALAEQAMAADAMNPEALVTLGSLALFEGRTADARASLLQALQRNRGDGRTRSALGFASLLEQDFPAAREHLEAAVLALPGHAQSWQALGWARLALQDRGGALAAFETALQLDEDAADSHAALGLAQVMVGMAAAAAPRLESAEWLDPEQGVAQLARALLQGALRPDELQALVQRLLAQWRPRP